MVLGRHDRRTELERVGGAQRMDAEQPDRSLADGRDRLHLAPGSRQALEPTPVQPAVTTGTAKGPVGPSVRPMLVLALTQDIRAG
jgi:hypothetical protein